jgi:hypothetical protein
MSRRLCTGLAAMAMAGGAWAQASDPLVTLPAQMKLGAERLRRGRPRPSLMECVR